MEQSDFIKRCPKTGRIVGFNTSNIFGKLLFPVVGTLAILWFLFRVIPKPHRIAYPCQQFAMSIGGTYLTYLSALILSYPLFNKLKKMNTVSVFATVLIIFLSGTSVLVFAMTDNPETFDSVLTPIEGSNNPMGVERGIFPGRVTWVQDFDATSWDEETGNWWDDNNTDQQVTDEMVSKAILNISGGSSLRDAWSRLFNFQNNLKGKGDFDYTPGELVVIKVNINPLGKPDAKWDDRGYPSPHMLNSLVKQLVNVVGVKGKDIKIVDPSRCFVGPLYEKIRSNGGEYLDIEFVGSQVKDENLSFLKVAEPDTSNKIYFNMPDGSLYKMCLPMCFSEADYIIDYALFRPHRVFGITNVAKNHFGSVWDFNKESFTPAALHAFALWDYPTPNKHGDPHSSPVLLGHRTIHDKTILYFVDALYSGYNQSSRVKRFSTMNNEWLSSLLVSLDPVALESVCLDLISSEPNLYKRNPSFNGNQDSQLHECALANDPPSGTYYDPEHDGSQLLSLGVHEHWNNPRDKQYSRNLGKDSGIELIFMK